MSWTRGQSSNHNQSPFIDPNKQPKTQNQNVNQRRDYGNRTSTSPQTKDYYNTRPELQSPQGNDTAATFTKEGLQTFAQIFSTSVEAAMKNVLPGLVERAVEEKFQRMLSEAVDIITETVTRQLASVTSDIQESVQQQVKDPLEIQDREEGSDVEHGRPHTTVSGADPEVENVIQALERAGGRMTAQQLRATANIDWGKNSTVKMNSIMRRANGRIERAGRGIYQIHNAI